MLGDNIYGCRAASGFPSGSSNGPTRGILDRKIPFYAALGNHDDPNQRFYEPFNMNGQRFYSFEKHNVRFLALDSNYMDKDQQAWLEEGTVRVEGQVDDRVLPPPALFIRRDARFRSGPSRDRRA